MINYFLISTITTLITLVLYVPFIGLLYRLKIQKDSDAGRTGLLGDKTPRFQQLHAHKQGTPTGGGVLVVLTTLCLYVLFAYSFGFLLSPRSILILLVFILFGLFGLYDDIRKVLPVKGAGIVHIPARTQLLMQAFLATLVANYGISYNLFILNLPGFGRIDNYWVLLALTVFTIIAMSNSYNIYDGVDGLGAGSMLVTIVSLIAIFGVTVRYPTDTLFLAILFGALLAYLFFNIPPARLFNGDAGTFSVGAVIALLMLLNNLLFIFPVLCFMYLADAGSSFLQMLSKKYLNRRIFYIAPIHHHFEHKGWSEAKVTMRFWLVNIFFSILALGLYLSFKGV